jgi:hypothetical protein
VIIVGYLIGFAVGAIVGSPGWWAWLLGLTVGGAIMVWLAFRTSFPTKILDGVVMGWVTSGLVQFLG